METSIVTVKGQIVVPAKIRRKFGIKKGTKVAFIEKEGKLIIQPLDKNYFESLAGILGTEGKMLKSLLGDKKKERELCKAAVLDSYALIAYLEREGGYEEVSKIFDECVMKDREVFVSVVNWGEVIYHALRSGGEQTARLAEDAMRALPIQVVDVNKELTLQAAQLKASHKMSYADCFAAALAMKKKCELVTGGKELKQVERRLKVRWI
jgi:AbrB family looped-hinge helix DNA binding protein